MNFWDWNYVAQILPDLLQASLKTLGITLVGFLIAVSYTHLTLPTICSV